ncbi:DnaD domain-containing protein [Cytobacillus firmus]|uniref:DnaD domain-containing protein n=1 Tax=Cytobacillus firmus TaxID=1399 RepID=UPI0018CD469F|nr:DnaD domain protein [Cytobacillus firmus]MED1942107.1 DnaD domain protein [Cytobacillus firmus]
MGGAFQTSRDIFQNPIWQDIPKFRIFFYIVGNAVFSKDGVRIGDTHIQRGQFLRSYRNLADDLNYIENRKVKKYSISVISRKIEQLVKEERLKTEDTELGTLFTVVNYEIYQGFENYKSNELGTGLEQSWNGEGTGMEQHRNNNKNVNKDKNVKKDITTTTAAVENPIQLFEKLLCRLSEMQIQKLYAWQDDFDGQAEIINEAIRIADDKNKRFFGFVEYLLKEWANNNLKTIDRVRAYEQEKFNKAKVKPYQRKGTVRTEMLPEWFEESKQPKQEKKALPEDDIARKKAELKEKLKKLRSGTES